MSYSDCHDFRVALSRALEGLPVPPALTALSWHEHLLGCGECRELLESEEALEVLLATLPDPKLPPELSERIVARLSATRAEANLDNLLDLAEARAPEGMSARVLAAVRGEEALDRLLERDLEPEVPPGLAARVGGGLAAHRAQDPLDRLLELDSEPELPAGLSRTVLAGLEAERGRVLPRLQLLRHVPLFAAAAGLVLAALGWTVWGPGGDTGSKVAPEEVASHGTSSPSVVDEEPDPQLLAMLDVLENDDLWRDTAEGVEVADSSDDLPLLLADTLDPGDEILLAFLDE